MKHMKIFGLALVAAFAVAAMAAAVASAVLPEFDGPFPKSFHALGLGGTLETTGGHEVKCTSNHVNGEITGPKHDLATIRFLGCTTPSPFGGRIECNTSGEGSGVIATQKLLSLLGYIKRLAPTEVGVLIEPASTELFAEFLCGGIITIKVKGNVVGKIEPLNIAANKFPLLLKQAAGKPNPAGLESGPDLLATSVAGGAFEESGIEQTDELELNGGATGIILA
jgi:hypothetical protein